MHSMTAGRVADNRAYVFAALEGLRTGLKRRDVFIPAGVRYADPRRGLLSGEAWNAARLTICRSLDRSPDAESRYGVTHYDWNRATLTFEVTRPETLPPVPISRRSHSRQLAN